LFTFVSAGQIVQLLAVMSCYSGILVNLATVNKPKILQLNTLCTTVHSGKTMHDIPKSRMLLLAGAGNAADKSGLWSEKSVNFMSNYQSCYTNAPFKYLLHKDDVHKVADFMAYETLNMILIVLVQFNVAVNLAFAEDNKILMVVLNKSLGMSNSSTI
jgi:hypothetical protein